MKKLINKKWSIHVTVVTVFVTAIMITALVAIGLQYYFTKNMATEAAKAKFSSLVGSTSHYLEAIDSRASQVVQVLSHSVSFTQQKVEQGQTKQIFAEIMRTNTLFFAINIGFDNGDLFQLINLDSHPIARQQLKTGVEDRWVLVTVTGEAEQRQRRIQYFDERFESTTTQDRVESSDYDVRQRSWYQQAQRGKVIKTKPYMFESTDSPGQTFSMRFDDNKAVISVDITLSSISDFFTSSELATQGEIYLFQHSGELIASDHGVQRPTDSDVSVMVPYPELIKLVNERRYDSLTAYDINDQTYLFYLSAIGPNVDTADQFAYVVPESRVLAPAMQKVHVSLSVSVLVLLLLGSVIWSFANLIVNPIKALAKVNEKIIRRQYDQVEKPESYIKELDELGQSMLGMAESIQDYQQQQQTLMDSIISLIADAIDEKSHYTAGHCARVPELAFMLAEQAESTQEGPFAEFLFKNADAWREFKIGAWLHDCGKITTPEHIVDKGSKLEVIYNRIHEIRTRFEVLLRDAEIDYWQQCVKQPELEEQHKQELIDKQQQLKDDFAFVAEMNVGGEYLTEDKKARIQQIAQKQWTRHLSNRIGLSPAEEMHVAQLGAEPSLPITEAVIIDRPEHLIERAEPLKFDEHLGIKMAIPELLYNQGELYNLLIERGTLTNEDRFKINEHIISTIKMLDKLPFSNELSEVPRFASTHHETLIGTGYPRKLTAKDLSMPEKMMVLADVFEALTAADRPYKKAKPISEAIAILHRMVIKQHIDRDVFELFLSKGVYRQYAKKFLKPEQLDEVDISQYLSAWELKR